MIHSSNLIFFCLFFGVGHSLAACPSVYACLVCLTFTLLHLVQLSELYLLGTHYYG